MGSATDQQFKRWATQIRSSNERAFSELFQAVYPRMIKFAWRYTRDKADADDVVQTSFVKLWEVRKNIDPDRSLKAYLYQIVRSRALNHIRDKKEHRAIEDVRANKLKRENRILSNLEESQHYERYEQKMAKLIADLPNRQREAMELSRFEGFEHDEISTIMDISPRTVNNHIVAALKTLRKEWNAYKRNQEGELS